MDRNIVINARSNRWNRMTKAAWTRRVLPDLRRWVLRRPKDLTFHVTQALTGHECFRHCFC
ncbi:Hypothetical protein CINCED_3A004525 [Cinara cedri]|uniref:Uncharacterized protein n=1 Tax=Cinara cedri TaxID=506608 RepID=A0A5E4NCW5_9HEMI|nr:Hypothetical protein CINCED_3A004525 [Cinara cedri]